MKSYVFVVVALVACSKDPSSSKPPDRKPATSAIKPPPAPKPPPKGTWSKHSNNLQLEAPELKYDARVGVTFVGGKLSIRPANLPNGTVIQVGETRHEITKGADWFDIPMDGPIGDVAWEKLKRSGKSRQDETHDWNMPIVVTLPGREPLQTQLPPMRATLGLEKLFVAMATSSRTWPDETTGPAPAAAAWTINGFQALGTAEKTRDVRMVVMGKAIDNKRTRRCTGYVGAKDFTATSYDLELSIVDRVTKQTLATKTFAGKPACPQFVYSGPNAPPASHTGPPHKTMTAWVSSQLPALAKKL